MSEDARARRAERLRDWFALQLEFAERLAVRAELPLDMAVTYYTNLHPRFGFGRPSRDGWSRDWDQFVRELVRRRPGRERIEFTTSFAMERCLDWSAQVARQFGCFGFEGPTDGVIRIHFVPADSDNGVGPLSRAKSTRRIEELAQMFAFIRQGHALDAREVVGGSWLYNLDAYRRLFPPAYIARLYGHTSPSQLTGGSWWGQFLDHEENVVVERVDEFTARLADMDPAALWKLFPMPPMKTRLEIDAFYAHYGVAV